MQLIARVDLADHALALPSDTTLEQAHRELVALLAEGVGGEAVGLFAQPMPAGDHLDYLVPDGRIARFDELDATGRDHLRSEIGRVVSLLRRAAEGKAAGEPGRFGHLPALVRAAIEIPSFELVFAHEGRPVLAAWGMVPNGAPGGLGLVRALDDGMPFERKAGISPQLAVIAMSCVLAIAVGAFLVAPWLARLFAPPEAVCRVVPAEREALVEMDDERRRERELRATLASLQRELGNRRAVCPIPVLPAPPQPPPPPPLPADRWAQKDLGILQGCWRLGRDAESTHELGGGRTERCTVKAGRICFGSNGSGERNETRTCPSTGTFTCTAPVTARFGDDSSLGTSQPTVPCTPAQFRWNGPPSSLTCRRVSDTLALCRDRLNFEHEFRRE